MDAINETKMGVKQLLLIDDNEENQLLIKTAIETTSDWKVSVAEDGVEGVTIAELERPDAILLDFVMPGLDGFTVYNILKSNLFTSTIPIIFITGVALERVLERLETTSAAGIIIKPFDTINLHDQIAQMCQWK